MKRIASSWLTISLNPSFSLHMVFPLSQKFVHATSIPQKILRVSQQKMTPPRFERTWEQQLIHKRRFSHPQKIHSASREKTWIQVDLRGLSSTFLLDSALGRLKHRGTKKNGQMPTRKKTGQSLHVFLNKCSVNVQTYKRFLFGAVLVFIIIIFFEEIFWVQNYWIFFLGIEGGFDDSAENAGQIPSDFWTCGSVSSISLIPSFFCQLEKSFPRSAHCRMGHHSWSMMVAREKLLWGSSRSNNGTKNE